MVVKSEMVSFQDLMAEIARATKLQEGAKGIELVLRTIYQTEPIGLKPLSRKVRLPVPVVAAIRGELGKRNILAQHGKIAFTDHGRHIATLGKRITLSFRPKRIVCWQREWTNESYGTSENMLRPWNARRTRKTLSFSKSDLYHEIVTHLFTNTYNLSLSFET